MRSRAIILFSLCLLLSSCALIKNRIEKGDVVAQLGPYHIYRNEIEELVPIGTTSLDSALIVNNYIYSWARQYLKLMLAEEHLSKTEKDVKKELDEYRASLLTFRYEKAYLGQRLDTTVTEEMTEEYYRLNEKKLISESYLLKVRYVEISKNSPNYKVIRSLYKSNDRADVEKLKSLAYSSALEYSDFEDLWLSSGFIADKMNISKLKFEEKIKLTKENFDEESAYLVRVLDKVVPGDVLPYEYARTRIEKIIISKRKQELLLNLEKELLEDALASNKLIIY